MSELSLTFRGLKDCMELFVMKMISWIACAIIFNVVSAQETEIQHMGGVSRLNDDQFTDNYFICKTNGTRLLWRINNSQVIDFRTSNDNGTVMANTLPAYQYVSTLVLNQPNAGNHDFVSLLVLSTNNSQSNSFSVECFNNLLNRQTQVSDSQTQNEFLTANITDSILLQYLFPFTINSKKYYFYICGVNTPNLIWEFGGERLIFVSNSVNIGAILPSSSNEQDFSVLIGRNPFSLVALFIRETPELNVTCANSLLMRATISYLDLLEDSTEISSSSQPPLLPPGSKTFIYIRTAVIGILILFVAVVLVCLVILCYTYRHRFPEIGVLRLSSK